ncbi:hypothetical protein Bca101_096792 [Brassica carinata]
MSPAKMNKTVAAAEDTEGIYKRNKQDEYDFMNSTSPPRSSPEGTVSHQCAVEEEIWRIRFRFILLLFGNKRSFLERGGTISEFTTVTAVLIARGSLSDKNEEWKKMMERSFTRMDMEAVRWEETVMNANCKCELQTPNCDAVGSTAVVSVITPEKIIVANCGDSRAVLCVLATSRAIGDNYLKPYVSSEPEVTVTERSEEDEFMILASDGLWDVVTNDAACATVQIYLNKKGGRGGGRRREATECEERKEEKVVGSRKNGKRGEITDKACAEASVLLTNLALGKHSSDNVSVVVIDLSRRRKRHVA